MSICTSSNLVTGDIPLAARVLGAGALAIGNDGRPYEADSIGDALAMRDLHATLRESGVEAVRPRALTDADRSRFLSRLDQLVRQSLVRADP